MAVGQRLSLRCFLEGIEVPIISAALSIQMDAPAQCSVQLPATDAIMKLKPRTLVHIFYYDYWEGPGDSLTARATEASEEQVATSEQVAEGTSTTGGSTGEAGLNSPEVESTTTPTSSTESDGATTSSTESTTSRPDSGGATAGPVTGGATSGDTEGTPPSEDPETWRIYFIGEVTAIQFSKSAQNRSVVLNCMDNSVYWDTCYQYAANSTANLTGNGQANFVGAGTSLFDTFWSDGTSTIVNVVRSQPISQPDLRGLLAGVVALLERVGGVYRRGNNNFAGVNDFFTIAELRLKLVYQITAASEDFSSQRVFSRRAFHFWGRRQAGRLGKIASFREIVNLMNKFIFHNVVPNPIALYESPHTEERTRVRTGSVSIANTSRGREITRRLQARIQALNAYSSPSEAAAASLIRSSAIDCRNIASEMRRAGATSGAPTLVTSVNAELQAGLGILRRTTDRATGEMSNQGLGNLIALFDSAARELQQAARLFSGNTRSFSRNVTSTHHTGNRLNSQIVRPDIYFVSPPRCNVLFPELYSQVSYMREYMREVTRMRLTVSDEIFGEDALLNNCYYAPDVAVIGARRRSQLGRGSRRQGSSEATEDRTLSHAAYSKRIMDHELYVGIIPTFERMNEVNIYGNRTDTVTHRGARIPYVARAVNHQFFKHRFLPRTISVAGKFNPSAVCGFPMLVIDKHMNSESTQIVTEGYFTQDFFERLWQSGQETAEAIANGEEPADATNERDEALAEAWDILRSHVPTQYMGLVAQMSHTVSQQEGSTQYAMQYARTHNENEELLGANNVRVARRAPGRSPTRTTVVAAMSAPREGMVGPYHGIISEVEESTRTGQFLLFGTFSGSRPRRQQTRVIVGVTQSASAYGPEVSVLAGGPNVPTTFQAYRVVEIIDRWSGDSVDVPLEDFIRPPWMSDIWRNDRIGSAYHQLFGTGAITDPMVVSAGGDEKLPDASVSDEQAVQDENAVARNESEAGGDVADPTADPQLADNTEAPQTPVAPDAGADSLGDADAASSGETIQSSLTDINVERATNLLVRIYSSLKHNGLDVNEFIRAYNWRPVATMTEILGSADLEIDEQGRKTRGTEGFHSRAFGHKEMGRDLRNLINPDDTDVRTLLRINPDTDRDNVLNRLDKRAEKAEVVTAYVSELWQSRGLLG